ncbi:Suppressor of G2 allele of SKP1 like protein [Fukomys damarensis]|uniref:Suppressor of G2 allele of SKP1 like protein n=1 Tax=Fukomys damarensis TaxID=885580 RepID=A0A091D1C2_FUKDA|nr:Suppressor of G2 allele of SKP1 like protein [Fukomys damarensis]
MNRGYAALNEVSDKPARSKLIKNLYPSSSRYTRNWDKLVGEIKEEEKNEELEGDTALNKLFQQIYSDDSDEVKRAINKSLMESGGTVLNTNWSDVDEFMPHLQEITCARYKNEEKLVEMRYYVKEPHSLGNNRPSNHRETVEPCSLGKDVSDPILSRTLRKYSLILMGLMTGPVASRLPFCEQTSKCQENASMGDDSSVKSTKEANRL